MDNLVERAAFECNVPKHWVYDIIRRKSSRVKIFRIPKRSNPSDYRRIYRPSSEMALLQRWLTLRVFNSLPVHESAMAFVSGRSILDNAKEHVGSRFFLRVDFENFFESIKFDDLIKAMNNSPQHLGLMKLDDNLEFIRKICFNLSERLPIGYISSPIISNLVMYDFDVHLSSVVQERKGQLGESIITRYADDIVFSTNKKGGCKVIFEDIKCLVDKFDAPKLKINERKTLFTSSSAGSSYVTGLKICPDKHITISRAYKDKVRLMMSLYEKGVLKEEDVCSLKGHLSYIAHVEPAFYSKICSKYFTAFSLIRAVKNVGPGGLK